MNAKSILKIVPGLQAMSILAGNIPKKDEFSPKPKKDFAVKRIVKRGIGTLVGIGLLKPTAKIISDM